MPPIMRSALPIFVDGARTATPEAARRSGRLMIAQDVGSAIRGPERGDIFLGTGEAAGAIAGTTRARGAVLRLAAEALSRVALCCAMGKRGHDERERRRALGARRSEREAAQEGQRCRQPEPAQEAVARSRSRRPQPPRQAGAQGAAEARSIARGEPLDRQTARQLERGRLARRSSSRPARHAPAGGARGAPAIFKAAQGKGYRHVLVITGKGRDPKRRRRFYAEEEPGVLRQAVPHWLAEPELADIVVSYSPAPRRLGGEGALYVRVRKA